jgi:hypothetical protein
MNKYNLADLYVSVVSIRTYEKCHYERSESASSQSIESVSLVVKDANGEMLLSASYDKRSGIPPAS